MEDLFTEFFIYIGWFTSLVVVTGAFYGAILLARAASEEFKVYREMKRTGLPRRIAVHNVRRYG